MSLRSYILAAALAFGVCGSGAQVIQFESGGLRYQTLSQKGVTVMFANLPAQLRDYSIVQIGMMNGSRATQTIRPEDFSFRRADGTVVFALPARSVVDHLLARASRNDVVKLINTYEMGLNGVSRFRSTNGYEQRRQSALAEMGSAKLRAAAAASAIALVATKLLPGESTDGAVFFNTDGKPLGPGRLSARTGGQVFEFESHPDSTGKSLQQRPGVSEDQN